jgi:acyl-CoA hydrolase
MNYKVVSAEEAVKVIKSGDRVHLSSVAVTPHALIKAMVDRGKKNDFTGVRIHHIHTEGPAPYASPEFEGVFQLESFFCWRKCA